MTGSGMSGWWSLLRNQREIIRRLGIHGWVSYRVQDFRLARAADGLEVDIWSPLAAYPLRCRTHTSDHFAFAQVFVDLAYASVPAEQDPSLIIDCGANVGYSSAYFLTRFKQARLIALEPDAENFRCLNANLAPYGTRATCIHGALWSHSTDLRLRQPDYRDGGYWSRQVEEGRAEDRSAVPGFTIPALMDRAKSDRISILKIDIEGAEAVVFGSSDLSWIDRVDTIMIELHDDTAFGNSTMIFHNAIAGRGFHVWHTKELTVCSRRTR
jgi:FkbM family methyltransferase